MLLAGSTAVALRLLLAQASEVSTLLQNRVEIATPVTSIRRVREGLYLKSIGSSPYTGSAYHAAPLLLPVLSPWAGHRTLYVVPFVLLDVMGALLIYRIAQKIGSRFLSGRGGELFWTPQALACWYLWNPLLLLACVGASSAVLENVSILLALYGCVYRSPTTAGLGVALGTYLSLHPLLLLIPCALAIYAGCEDVLQRAAWPPPADDGGGDEAGGEQLPRSSEQGVAGAAGERCQHAGAGSDGLPQRKGCGRLGLLAFLGSTLAFLVALFFLSDLSLLPYHLPALLPLIPSALRPAAAVGPAARLHSFGLAGDGVMEAEAPGFSAAARARSWIAEVYGFVLWGEELSPNIGQHWYFFTEMFPHFVPFFKLVFHLLAAGFAAPMAVRLPHRPLWCAFCQCWISAMLRPFPCTANLGLPLALLPLFSTQLSTALGRAAVLLLTALALLLVLGPAMYYQWIFTASANSNFFYSITLLLGAWQVVLLAGMMSATLRHDRLLLGKPALPEPAG